MSGQEREPASAFFVYLEVMIPLAGYLTPDIDQVGTAKQITERKGRAEWEGGKHHEPQNNIAAQYKIQHYKYDIRCSTEWTIG